MMRALRSSSISLITFTSFLLTYTIFISLIAPFIQETEAAPAPSSKPAASANASPTSKRRWRDGELLVRFRQGISEREKNALVATSGARRVKKLRGTSRLEKLHLTTGRNPQALAAELRRNPVVEIAEPNYLIDRDEIVPDDPRFGEQWALRNTGAGGGQAGSDINAATAWETNTGAPTTVIAVVDSGIDFTHPELANNQWTNSSEQPDGVDNDQDGRVDDLHGWDWVSENNEIKDEHGHGTAVAGIIAAEGNNGAGISGVMWRASLMSLRVLDNTGTGDIAGAVEAIDYAVAHGAQVINCSWGTDDESLILKDAITRAATGNVIVVCAAGNNGGNNDSAPYYPASFDLPNVIAVASTDNLDQLTSWSNRGARSVTVAAPGENILSTKMGGDYEAITGTSASAPLVTGVAGLIKTLRPLLSAERTRQMIVEGVRQVAALSGKVSSGGVVNASGALDALNNIPPEEGLDDGSGNGGGGGNSGGSGGGGGNGSAAVPPPTAGTPGTNLPDLDAARALVQVIPKAPKPLSVSSICNDCGSGGNAPPTADAGESVNGQEGQEIEFNASASSDEDGWIISYEWDFGDGTTGDGAMPSHTYESAGNYEVTLTVTDNEFDTGTASTSARITAQPPPESAEYISQSAQTTANIGQHLSVSVTFKNTSGYTWTTAGLYRLGAQNPQHNNNWGAQSVELPSSVTSGSQVTFNFTVTAPTTPGTYDFQWQMMKGTQWLGESTPNVRVYVTPIPLGRNKTPYDFDGDGKTDLSTWRSSDGTWQIINSSDGTTRTAQWGMASLGDQIVPADYDGDNKTDLAVWRHSSGNWYIIKSTDGTVLTSQWGASGDVPVPADYDGDHRADLAVFRPSTGIWYILRSTNGTVLAPQWGASGDVPVPADYDGDRKTDFAVWKPGQGAWFILQSFNNSSRVENWGSIGDVPVPEDYDGDGKADLGIWRPDDGKWYLVNSSDGALVSSSWGASGDVPVPGDYDGDHKTDLSVFRPAEGKWYVLNSSNATVSIRSLGNSTDIAVPSAGVKRASHVATFVAQWVPNSMLAGQIYDVAITFRNDGISQWDFDGQYVLRSQNPQNSSAWGSQIIELPLSVEPGSEVTFSFSVTAPLITGSYNFQWRMMEGNVDFGDYTPTTVVNVTLDESTGGTGVGVPSTPTDDHTEAERLDTNNRAGQPGVDAYSGNFNWGLPLLNLPGRAGLDLGLSLTYNSLLWTKALAGDVPVIRYDADNGYPGPGFRLGFPVIQPAYTNPQGIRSYLMLMPSGQRVELRQKTGTPNTYEAYDSSYLQLTESGSLLTVRATSGTQMTYVLINGEYRCNQIKDRNGNFIAVTYNLANGLLLSITDTLARVISFKYDNHQNLMSINQTWTNDVTRQPQTHQWATFGYGRLTLRTNFPGLTLRGAQNGESKIVLTQVGLDDGSYYRFEYTPWGQVWKITRYAADNHKLNYVSYNLPQASTVPQSDCPRVTEERVWAENWNQGLEAKTTYTRTTGASWTMPGNTYMTGTKCEVKTPDNTVLRIYSKSDGWEESLPVLVETWVPNASGILVKERWSTTAWTQDNPNVSYLLNPRSTEANVYDSDGNRQRTTVNDTFINGLPASQDVREYDTNATTVLRRTQTDFNLTTQYTSRRILGLVKLVSTYEGENTLISKVEYRYDEVAPAPVKAGDPSAPAQHDQSYWTSPAKTRANLTSVLRYDKDFRTDTSKALVSKMGYDTAGSMVYTSDPLQHRIEISYADSFSDHINTRATYAYPTKVTDPDEYSATVEYEYDFGGVTRTEDPKHAIVETSYDAAARVVKVKNSFNNAYRRWVYPTSHNFMQSFTKVEAATNAAEAYTIQVLDGAGHMRARAEDNPGSAGRYSGTYTVYDVMGLALKASHPTEIKRDWVAAGDDDAGWRWNTQTYDWKGRPRTRTDAGGKKREARFEGCGCAGGEVVTLIDETGRQQKQYQDVLGRLVKTEALNANGSVYLTTTNKYNALDQVLLVTQKGATGLVQETEMTYDGYGRLETRKLPYQTNATTFTYQGDDLIKTMTDARGAKTTYGYNNRHLLTSVTYSAPNGSGITVPSDIAYGYDEAGNRKWMTDGLGRADYELDTLSRLWKETRTFNDTSDPSGLSGSYALTYTYNLANELTSITDHFGTKTVYDFDPVGRLTGVDGEGLGVTNYVSDIKYRAWGAIKNAAYGDGISLEMDYNERLQVSTFKGMLGSSVKMGNEYQYYDDGRIRYSHDLNKAKFDRWFKYDHIGRLAEARTGNEANGGTTADGPYRQSFSYDVWSNVTTRASRHWSRTYPDDLYSYANNRNANWQYDEDGRLLKQPGTFSNQSGVMIRTPEVTNRFDAAGHNIYLRTKGGFVPNFFDNTLERGFDGDEQVIKEKSTEVNSSTPTRTTHSYYLRSTVLKGQVIATLDEHGQKTWSYVYDAQGQVVANKRHSTEASSAVVWHHQSPSGSTRWKSSDANVAEPLRTEFDPVGASVVTEDPYTNSGGGGVNTASFHQGDILARFANPGAFDFGCTVDFVMTDCSFALRALQMGAAVIAPQQTATRVRYRGQETIGTFRAFSDGYQGVVPVTAQYVGNGNFADAGAPGLHAPYHDTNFSQLNGATDEAMLGRSSEVMRSQTGGTPQNPVKISEIGDPPPLDPIHCDPRIIAAMIEAGKMATLRRDRKLEAGFTIDMVNGRFKLNAIKFDLSGTSNKMYININSNTVALFHYHHGTLEPNGSDLNVANGQERKNAGGTKTSFNQNIAVYAFSSGGLAVLDYDQSPDSQKLRDGRDWQKPCKY